MNPNGTPDVNTVSLYDRDSGQNFEYTQIDGTAGTAALKITSRATKIRVRADKLLGGSENCLDLNGECEDIIIDCNDFFANGKYAISSKACSNVILRGHLTGSVSKWHVNLGSWSDQSKRKQTGTQLELTAEHYPIVVWVGNSDKPAMDDPSKYKLIGFGRFGSTVIRVVMFFWDIGKRLNLA